jgi:hypothetical protein
MSRYAPIWKILLYLVCIVGGAVAGLVGSDMIVTANAGPECCNAGDGIGFVLFSMFTVPVGITFGVLVAATILRVARRRADGSATP